MATSVRNNRGEAESQGVTAPATPAPQAQTTSRYRRLREYLYTLPRTATCLLMAPAEAPPRRPQAAGLAAPASEEEEEPPSLPMVCWADLLPAKNGGTAQTQPERGVHMRTHVSEPSAARARLSAHRSRVLPGVPQRAHPGEFLRLRLRWAVPVAAAAARFRRPPSLLPVLGEDVLHPLLPLAGIQGVTKMTGNL